MVERCNSGQNWLALVVDDEEPIRLTLSAILQLNRFAVVSAASARDACEWLHREQFDLVITDLKMEKETSGFEVTECAAKHCPNGKTIILSAYAKLAVDWQKHGAHAFCQKPTSTTDLLRVIDGLLAKSSSDRRGVTL